jgi:hypothetical protein
MSRWRFLDSVPKDGTPVLFWVPRNDDNPLGEGVAVSGSYDAVLGTYSDGNGEDIYPIGWLPCPSGPRSMADFDVYVPGWREG